jgi:uncharacterized protein (UPF0548 family)
VSGDRLLPYVADRLRDLPLTYAEVGASAAGLPAGYHHVESTTPIPGTLTALAERLFAWQVQRGAGIIVAASSDRIEAGAVALLRVGIGPLRLRAPVRVVKVIDEHRRQGFAYGTLPGHPESGEELFLLEEADDGSVTLTIRAFSRPATFLARAGGPAARWTQRRITRRYERALVG